MREIRDQLLELFSLPRSEHTVDALAERVLAEEPWA